MDNMPLSDRQHVHVRITENGARMRHAPIAPPCRWALVGRQASTLTCFGPPDVRQTECSCRETEKKAVRGAKNPREGVLILDSCHLTIHRSESSEHAYGVLAWRLPAGLASVTIGQVRLRHGMR